MKPIVIISAAIFVLVIVAMAVLVWLATPREITKITVNNQWPVFYPLEGVKPGKYIVAYRSSEGEQTAGSFDVP